MTTRNWIVIAGLVAACGKGGSKPAEKGSGTVTGSATTSAGSSAGSAAGSRRWSITLPAGAGGEAVRSAHTFVVYRDDALTVVDPVVLFGDPDGPITTLADGVLTPTADPLPAAKAPAPPDAPVVIIADRAASATALLARVSAAYAHRCWGLLVVTDGQLATLAPDPCPPTRPDNVGADETVELAAWRGADKWIVGISRINDLMEVLDPTKLAAVFHEQKQNAFFSDRTDVAIGVHDGATVADAVDLLSAAHTAGFVGARWIAAAHLPAKLADGVGTEPEPR